MTLSFRMRVRGCLCCELPKAPRVSDELDHICVW